MNRREFFRRSSLAGTAAGILPGIFSEQFYAAAASREFQAGYFETDITPAVGMEQPGGYGKSYHESLHDPCKVRAAVFDDRGMRVALVRIDALTCPRALAVGARRRIHERCGIAQEAILIGASHSHSSGPVAMVQPGAYDHGSPLVRELAYEKSWCADPAYAVGIRQRTARARC